MSNMFYGFNNLTNIDVSNFNTKNVTDMKGMFKSCILLKKSNIFTNDKKIIKLL